MARLGPVEIYDVQTLKAQLLKLLCLGNRVFIVYLLLRIVPFGQAHTFAVDEVYGRYQFYLHHTGKFRCRLFHGEEIVQQTLAHLAALLRMELGGPEIVLVHGR